MKNFSKILFGLGAAFAMTSCANEEVVNPAATSDVTVSVITETGISSRALATVDGYELKCVMQLLDDNGVTVGSQAVESAAAGKASFIIKAADIDNGASKALFWAEYVPTAAAAKVYDSSDLTKISYQVTDFNMADANLMAAADAFAGTITTLTNGASVTLTRPMIQFNFAPTNPDAATGATTFKVAYSAPSAYNVLTGNCDAAANQALVYNNAAFEPVAKGNWFTSYIFAPANMAKLDQAITMTLGGGIDKTLTIEAGKLPLDANYIVNAKAEISTGGGDQNLDVTVNVGVDGDFENEPKPAAFEVGSYVHAAGNATVDMSAAVAVVYHVGAIEGDEASLYPAAFAGKTIKGYAVALENTIKGRQQLNKDKIAAGLPSNQEIINGTQNTSTLVDNEVIGASDMIVKYKEFVAAHTLTASGSTTTDWYIPAQPQMQAWMSMLMVTTPFPSGDNFGPTGTDAFKALFPMTNIFDRDPFANCMYVTCSINAGNNVMGCSLTAPTADAAASAKFAQIDIKTKNQSVLCRPMFTIFE